MSLLTLFLLLMLLTFGVSLYIMRPTRTETAIQRQIEVIVADHDVKERGSDILKQEGFALSPWINDLIKQVPGASELQGLIQQAGSTWTAPPVILFSVLAGPLAGWVASFWIPFVTLYVVVGAAVGLSPYVYLYALRQARFIRCDSRFPDAIDLMARALRAGHSIQAAIEMVSNEVSDPVGAEFRRIYKEQVLGLPLREAIQNLVNRLPRPDVRFFATALLVQKETGGNLAHILDKAAEVTRERARLRGQVRVYSAQGRMTGWVLCSLPFALFALIGSVNPEYERVLFTDPIGVLLVEIGLGMMVVGILVIRKIINVKV
jgi:tight adherence protein B